jgi:hypothetical protein
MKLLPLLPAGAILAIAACAEPTTSPTERPQFAQQEPCPDFFVLVPAGPIYPKADKNGNGWVCVKENSNNTHVTDDKIL